MLPPTRGQQAHPGGGWEGRDEENEKEQKDQAHPGEEQDEGDW